MPLQYTKSIERQLRTDVLVVGSGSAGATAAIASANQGAQVILLERYGFMGGISTQVLDTFYGFYTPGQEARKVVGGVPDLIVEELFRRKAALYRPNTYGAGQGITYDPETLKLVWETLAVQAGIHIRYHTLVIDVMLESGQVVGVIAADRAGLLAVHAGVVIDASGDAEVAAAAGAPYESAEHGPVQSLTTTFRLVNVDVPRARQVKKDVLHREMARAAESGDYRLPRREGSVHITPIENSMATNMTRVGQVDATDPEQLSQAEIDGRQQAYEYARFLKDRIPGYENASIGALSVQIGVRESRRIFGDFRLSREDVLQARKFEDAIAQCGAPIEDHHAGQDTIWQYLPEGETYHIPYRCLLPKEVDGLLVAGRCLSANHDAHASVRSMGQCMAMGQAAGIAAALCVQKRITPRQAPITELQDILRARGALF